MNPLQMYYGHFVEKLQKPLYSDPRIKAQGKKPFKQQGMFQCGPSACSAKLSGTHTFGGPNSIVSFQISSPKEDLFTEVLLIWSDAGLSRSKISSSPLLITIYLTIHSRVNAHFLLGRVAIITMSIQVLISGRKHSCWVTEPHTHTSEHQEQTAY